MRERTSSAVRGPLGRFAQVASITALGVLLGGCGAPARLPLSARAPGTTTVLVGNHLGGSDTVEHLRVSVDDRPIPLAAVPPPGDASAALGSLRLAPGPHTISVRLTSRGRDQGVVVVEAKQIFHVDERAAEIDIGLRSRPDPGDIDARVAIDLAMHGGHLNPELGAGPAEDRDAHCAPLRPIAQALCRAAADLDQASRRNDLVGVLCIRDKLTEMRQLALIGETSNVDVAGQAQARVQTLSRAIDRCAGDVAVGADGLVVIKPGAAAPVRPTPPVRGPGSQVAPPRSTARL